jgi:hypothetical protein
VETLNDNVERPDIRIAFRSRPQDVEQPLEEEQVDLVLGLGTFRFRLGLRLESGLGLGFERNLGVCVGNLVVDRGVRHGLLNKTGHNKMMDRTKDKARHEENRTGETDNKSADKQDMR